MIRRIVPVLAIAATAVVTGLPVAARAQEVKVGVIDVQRVVTESQTGSAALAELEALSAERRAVLEVQNQEAEALRTQLADSTLADADRAPLEAEFNTKITALRTAVDEASREVGERQQEMLEQIENTVMPIVQALGTEDGYTLILRKFDGGILYSDEAIDVTDTIIARLDAVSAESAPPAAD